MFAIGLPLGQGLQEGDVELLSLFVLLQVEIFPMGQQTAFLLSCEVEEMAEQG